MFILTTIMSISCSFASDNYIGGYFEPSGYYGNSPGYYYWLNYCPLCHHYGTLEKNPKGTYEGEITCIHCDADFDGTSGADKYVGSPRGWLIPYTKPILQPQAQIQPVDQQLNQTKSQKEILLEKWNAFNSSII